MRPAAFGGALTSPLTGDVVEADDGTVDSTLACNALINDTEISGNIALIDRGDCQFGTKSLNAQNAGATAVIICNNEPGILTMAGGVDGDQVNIPVVMITQADCATIRVELDNGLNATLDPSVDLDSDLDNGIIAHEYGHGISIRLTGGPSNSSCLQGGEQMGEGWSDFFGLWMTIESGDNHEDIRGIGTYVLEEPTDGPGIRPAPYTTDMTVNDFTYGNVDDGSISVPHGVGFIWCTMIWDLNWALVNAHGLDLDLYNGTGGNNITAQLIIDGMKGQPCSPGFVDARDAILDADMDNNNGENEDIIWNVFARRGLGFSATQGTSASRFDQTEAFDLPAGVPFMDDDELFGAGILPVELLSFTAIPDVDNKRVELFWSTAVERDNKGFELQRRSEDSETFESIAWVDGAGNSNSLSSYETYDQNIQLGTTYYYRLRQMDIDGKEQYSDVVSARLIKDITGIQLYPNPTPGLSTLLFDDQIRGTVLVDILNNQGQLLTTQTFATNGQAEIDIDLSNQPDGVYFLRFKIGEEYSLKKIVVKR